MDIVDRFHSRLSKRPHRLFLDAGHKGVQDKRETTDESLWAAADSISNYEDLNPEVFGRGDTDYTGLESGVLPEHARGAGEHDRSKVTKHLENDIYSEPANSEQESSSARPIGDPLKKKTENDPMGHDVGMEDDGKTLRGQLGEPVPSVLPPGDVPEVPQDDQAQAPGWDAGQYEEAFINYARQYGPNRPWVSETDEDQANFDQIVALGYLSPLGDPVQRYSISEKGTQFLMQNVPEYQALAGGDGAGAETAVSAYPGGPASAAAPAAAPVAAPAQQIMPAVLPGGVVPMAQPTPVAAPTQLPPPAPPAAEAQPQQAPQQQPFDFAPEPLGFAGPEPGEPTAPWIEDLMALEAAGMTSDQTGQISRAVNEVKEAAGDDPEATQKFKKEVAGLMRRVRQAAEQAYAEQPEVPLEAEPLSAMDQHKLIVQDTIKELAELKERFRQEALEVARLSAGPAAEPTAQQTELELPQYAPPRQPITGAWWRQGQEREEEYDPADVRIPPTLSGDPQQDIGYWQAVHEAVPSETVERPIPMPGVEPIEGYTEVARPAVIEQATPEAPESVPAEEEFLTDAFMAHVGVPQVAGEAQYGAPAVIPAEGAEIAEVATDEINSITDLRGLLEWSNDNAEVLQYPEVAALVEQRFQQVWSQTPPEEQQLYQGRIEVDAQYLDSLQDLHESLVSWRQGFRGGDVTRDEALQQAFNEVSRFSRGPREEYLEQVQQIQETHGQLPQKNKQISYWAKKIRDEFGIPVISVMKDGNMATQYLTYQDVARLSPKLAKAMKELKMVKVPREAFMRRLSAEVSKKASKVAPEHIYKVIAHKVRTAEDGDFTQVIVEMQQRLSDDEVPAEITDTAYMLLDFCAQRRIKGAGIPENFDELRKQFGAYVERMSAMNELSTGSFIRRGAKKVRAKNYTNYGVYDDIPDGAGQGMENYDDPWDVEYTVYRGKGDKGENSGATVGVHKSPTACFGIMKNSGPGNYVIEGRSRNDNAFWGKYVASVNDAGIVSKFQKVLDLKAEQGA